MQMTSQEPEYPSPEGPGQFEDPGIPAPADDSEAELPRDGEIDSPDEPLADDEG